MDSPDLVIIIGSFAGMLVGFFAILRYTLKQGSDDRTSDRKERQDLTAAIKNMASATDKVARVTADGYKTMTAEAKSGNDKSEKRNGHLGEQNIQLASMLAAQTIQLTSISNTLTSSANLLIKDTAAAHKGTEDVKQALIDNKPTGTFSFSGDLK